MSLLLLNQIVNCNRRCGVPQKTDFKGEMANLWDWKAVIVGDQ